MGGGGERCPSEKRIKEQGYQSHGRAYRFLRAARVMNPEFEMVLVPEVGVGRGEGGLDLRLPQCNLRNLAEKLNLTILDPLMLIDL